MTALVLGLVLFLGTHSVRIVADRWRSRQIARLGVQRWKGLYALLSLLGFGLLVWGYGLSRAEPVIVWEPPRWTFHVTALLTLPTFILLVAAYLPGTRLKAAIGHPMAAGAGLWALAHLLSNGRLGDLLLFGAFFVWATIDFRAARHRDRVTGTHYPVGPWTRDALAAGIGVLAWSLFAALLHRWLIGVPTY